jgi:hypothetical protein
VLAAVVKIRDGVYVDMRICRHEEQGTSWFARDMAMLGTRNLKRESVENVRPTCSGNGQGC